MPYQPVQVPPGTDPDLERLVRDTVDPLLRDVHAMLMLPIADEPGLDAGCNFSVALVLLGVVSGVSVALYHDPSLENVDRRERPGEAFIRLLTRHYPWDEEPAEEGAIRERHAAEVLYDAFRNPLSHNLGIVDPGDDRGHGRRKVAKGAMPDSTITEFEQASERPSSWGLTLYTDSPTKVGRTKTVLNIKLFYWGVRKMIWRTLEARPDTGVARADVRSQPSYKGTITATTVTTSTYTNVSSTAPDEYTDGGSPE